MIDFNVSDEEEDDRLLLVTRTRKNGLNPVNLNIMD